jgi:HD-GYP domain-containing protein (c-di-GMP phosphodiesterase class II)
VADVYDALTSARSYRGAMSPEDTMALITKGSGTHFDPAVTSALIRIYDRGDLNLDDMPSEFRQRLPGR